jgi:hypothetical protein
MGKGTTASRERAEGDYIYIDTLVSYSVPEFIDLTHPPIHQRRAMLQKGVD